MCRSHRQQITALEVIQLLSYKDLAETHSGHNGVVITIS